MATVEEVKQKIASYIRAGTWTPEMGESLLLWVEATLGPRARSEVASFLSDMLEKNHIRDPRIKA